MIAAVTTNFADTLGAALWQAYGKPLKFVACVVLVIVVGGPLLAFLRRVMR